MILGKWLAAVVMYGLMLLSTVLDILFLFRYGNPDWKPMAIGYLGLLLQAGGLLAIGTFISTLTKNQIIAGAVTFGVCLLLWVLGWVSEYESATWAQVLSYMSRDHSFRFVRQGRDGFEGRHFRRDGDFSGIVFYRALDGIPAVEVVSESPVDQSKTNQVRGVRHSLYPRGPLPSFRSPTFLPTATTSPTTRLRTSAIASPTRPPRS